MTAEEIYKQRCIELRNECDEMVRNGELTKADADFRYFMGKDEILWEMELIWEEEIKCN